MQVGLERKADAVEEWIGRYGTELRRHLQRLLGEAADVDDVLQDVWISATRNPPGGGPDDNVRAWLYRVATNAALDELARRRRREAVARRGRTAAVGEQAEPASRVPNLGDRARERIREECRRLPRKQREAVWLRLVDGLEYVEVARRIGSSVDSARANVYQGSKTLRRTLAQLWESEGDHEQ